MMLTLDDCSLELQALEASGDLELGAWRGVVSARQYRWLVGEFGQSVKAGAHVLDWGSGQGAFSYWLVRNGFDVSALDVRRPRLRPTLEALAPERYRFVMADDPVVLPFGDDEFDVVTSVGVLEHVRETGGNELGSLAEIRRVLRPDGLFVCVHFPNDKSWIEFGVRTFGVRKRAHPFRYTPKDVARLLRVSGFEMVASARYGVFPRNSTNRLPLRWKNSVRAADAVDAAEGFLGGMLSPIVQNHAFTARPRPTGGR